MTDQKLLQEVRLLEQKIEKFMQSEVEYKEIIRQFQSRLEAINDWVWEVDNDGFYRYSNKKVKDLLGYEPEDIIGKKPFSLMPENEAKRVDAFFKKSANSRQPFSGLENINQHKDGREVILETNAEPIFDDQGIFAGFRGIDRDITERKKMENALRENEKRYRMLADNATDVIYVHGLDMKYRYVSPSVKQVRGFLPEELVGQPISHFTKPESVELLKKAINEELKNDKTGTADPNRTKILEFEMLHKDGSAIWTEVKASFLRNDKGDPIEIMGIARDITERKKMENALLESEEKYRILVEMANEAIAIVQDGLFIFVNHRMSDLLGIPSRGLEGRPFVEFVWPEDRKLVTMNYEKRISGETVHDAYDFRFIGSGGKINWVFLSATTIRWNGKPATLNLMTDITDRKRTEEEREKLIVELRNALSKVKALSGLLPICASCKKIRNDKGYREQMEMYIRDHSEAEFSHGLCPECAENLYPDIYRKK